MKLRRLHNPKGWTSIPNAVFEDRAMSWRARGILGYLLSRPDGWETDSVRLAALAGETGDKRSRRAEGRDAVRTALDEIEAAKYLHRVRVQGSGGRWSTQYYVFDQPTEQAMPADLAGQIPLVDEPVDNSGENDPPKPENQASVNPASLTSTTKPLDPPFLGDLPSNSLGPVEKDAGSAVDAPLGLAALAESEPAQPALSSTDSIALVSRLEPGIQMFALRAHLRQVLGYQLDFDQVGALVIEAHEAAPPSHRGRLRDRHVIDWVEEFTSGLEPSVGSASVEASGSAALPMLGLPAEEPPLRGGSMDGSEMPDFSAHVNP
jgi:hypothetical protein